MVRGKALVLVALAGCNQVFGLDPVAHESGDGGIDAAIGDPSKGWSTPTPIAQVSTSATEDDPAISPDGLELYFSRTSGSPKDIYVSRRAGTGDPWPGGTAVTDLNSTSEDGGPKLMTGGAGELIAYFSSSRTGGGDIYRAFRAPSSQVWSMPALVVGLSSVAAEGSAAMCGNETRFVVASSRGGPDSQLYEVLAGNYVELSNLNSAGQETGPFLTEDCLTLLYASNKDGTFDLYYTHRDSVLSLWRDPVPIDLSTTMFNEGDPWLSPDGRQLLFASDRSGQFDIFEAVR